VDIRETADFRTVGGGGDAYALLIRTRRFLKRKRCVRNGRRVLVRLIFRTKNVRGFNAHGSPTITHGRRERISFKSPVCFVAAAQNSIFWNHLHGLVLHRAFCVGHPKRLKQMASCWSHSHNRWLHPPPKAVHIHTHKHARAHERPMLKNKNIKHDR